MANSHLVSDVAGHLLAQASAEDVAVVEFGHRRTYGELRAAITRIQSEFAVLGLPAGARVALLGPNSFFWIAAYLAIIGSGRVAVPLSDKTNAETLRRDLDVVEGSALVADRRVLRRLSGPALEGLLICTDELLATPGPPASPQADQAPAKVVDPDADAVLMFTSGTTSHPKAVRITHRNIAANTESIIAYLGLRRDDRALVVLPFFYCYGASVMHTHLRVGATLVLCPSFTYPEVAVDLLERERCTVFAGVPSSFQLLLRTSSLATRELPSLRIVQQAGGKLPEVLVREVRAAVPSAELFLMYGQTEATARLSYLPPEKSLTKPGSIGRGIPGVELRVLDENGIPVTPGHIGEIYAIGENISPGYFGDPDASTDKFTPFGLRTGDLATVDDDGDIFVVDRREDFIKTWGYRVSSQEIEACALGLTDLVAAAALGFPDDEAGEAVILFVSPRPGALVTEADVVARCRQHLDKHKVPQSVIFVGALPLTANGKVAKPKLRELVAQARADDKLLAEVLQEWEATRDASEDQRLAALRLAVLLEDAFDVTLTDPELDALVPFDPAVAGEIVRRARSLAGSAVR